MFWNLFSRSKDTKEYLEQKQLNYVASKSVNKVIDYLANNRVKLTPQAQQEIIDRGNTSLIHAMLCTETEFTDDTLFSIIDRNVKSEILAAFDNMVFINSPRTTAYLPRFALHLAKNTDNITLLTRCANELCKFKQPKDEFEKELIKSLSVEKLLAYLENNDLCEKAEDYLILSSSDFLFKELLESGYVCYYKTVEKSLVEMVGDNVLKQYLDTLQKGKYNLCVEAAEVLLTKHPNVVKEYIKQFKLLGTAQKLFIKQFPHLVEEYTKYHGFKGDEAQVSYVEQASSEELIAYIHKYGLTDKAEIALLKRDNKEEILTYIAERQLHKNAEAVLIKKAEPELLNEYLTKYRLHDGNDVILMEYVKDFGFLKIYLRFQMLSAKGDAYLQKRMESLAISHDSLVDSMEDSLKKRIMNVFISRDVFNAYATNHFWKLKEFYNSHQN